MVSDASLVAEPGLNNVFLNDLVDYVASEDWSFLVQYEDILQLLKRINKWW